MAIVIGLRLAGVKSPAISGRDDGSLIRFRSSEIGKNLSDETPTMAIQLRIEIVLGSLDENRKRRASHASRHFDNVILTGRC